VEQENPIFEKGFPAFMQAGYPELFSVPMLDVVTTRTFEACSDHIGAESTGPAKPDPNTITTKSSGR